MTTSVDRPRCRLCGSPLQRTFVDLGMSPPCESFLKAEQLDHVEPFYPLHVRVCGECFLVQLPEYVAPEAIFTTYAYFSSFSDTWVRHAREYTEMIIGRLRLDGRSSVVEIASNDGYLLRHFVERGIPCLGIEPATNVAVAAREKGVPTLTLFFGAETARRLVAERGPADLVVGNNVLSQIPNLGDFVGGIKILLDRQGVATLEFHHLPRLMERCQFDTIYHEHYSYFSLLTAEHVFAAHGLTIFDVEELPTHGGSLRIYARHAEDESKTVAAGVAELGAREEAAGLTRLDGYSSFARQVADVKHALLEFLIGARRAGKAVAGYGAPGKGNTLLNYCGIRTDLLHYTVDRNPYKQGLFLPGTHIPIYHPDKIGETRPDYVLILPWNLKGEIADQLSHARSWGARFVVPLPTVEVY